MIDPDGLICQLYRLNLTLICSFINSVEWNLEIDTHWLLLWLWLLLWYLIGSCVDSFDCDWTWSTHVSTLSTLIDPDWLICRLCRLNLTLLCSFVDSVERNHEIDTHWLLCWLWWLGGYLIWSCATLSAVSNEIMKSTLIGSCVVSGDFYRTWFDLVRLCRLWSTLFFSFVIYVDWDRPWSSLISTLLTVIDPDWLMCRLCRLFLKVICSCVD